MVCETDLKLDRYKSEFFLTYLKEVSITWIIYKCIQIYYGLLWWTKLYI